MKGSLDKYPRAQEIMQAIGLETNPEARMYQVSISDILNINLFLINFLMYRKRHILSHFA